MVTIKAERSLAEEQLIVTMTTTKVLQKALHRLHFLPHEFPSEERVRFADGEEPLAFCAA